MKHAKRTKTNHSAVVMEAVEPRRHLDLTTAGLLTSSFDVNLMTPTKENAGDGSGNKLTIVNVARLTFQTAKFSRVDSQFNVTGFVDADNNDPVEGDLALSFALYADRGTIGTVDGADTLVGTPTANSSFELDAGNYLYVITPTSGDPTTKALVEVKLRSVAVGGSKANLSASGVAIADGDVTPQPADFTDFGTVPVGVINNDRVFTVRNSGGATLTLGAVSVPAGFVVKAGLPATLAPGRSASFTIGMATAGAGTRSGVVSFATNDAAVGTYSFNITGAVSAKALPAKSGLQRLRINGTSGADTVVLTQNAKRVIFNVNGNLYSVLKTKIRRGISVDAFGGGDNISVDAGITLPVLIVGGDGDDTLGGGGGADTLLGLKGNDVLRGGIGADSIDGGDGTDTADYTDKTAAVKVDLAGNAADGTSGENDTVAANTENVLGGAGNDTITGSGGANAISGGGGKDFLLGGGGDDNLTGGAGNDTLRPGLGRDTLTGNAGQDTADYADHTQALFLSNDGVANDGQSGENDNLSADVERIIGGNGNDQIDLFSVGAVAFGLGGNDTLIGTDNIDALFGGAGNDFLRGYGGNDYLEGNDGDDRMFGENGSDTLLGGIGNDDVNGLSANDSVNGEAGDDTVRGDLGTDIVRGGSGNDFVAASGQNAGTGVDGIDSVFGDDGNDTLSGDFDDFADRLDGGLGIDTIADDSSTEEIDERISIP
ncbi:MAG TPA: choice-of-anchor D domain-containing protein [Tepidisphaeraceae bacterium]|jgi:Ca2+-binding RTX toxin-like protein